MPDRFFYTGDDAVSDDRIFYLISVADTDWVQWAVRDSLVHLTQEKFWRKFGSQDIDAGMDAGAKVLKSMVAITLVGMICPFVNPDPDDLQGWLLCDGTQYLKSDYPVLANLLGAVYEDDSTHFHVPDLAGVSLVGSGVHADLGSLAVDDIEYGSAEHAITEDELPSHSHTYDKPTVNVDVESVGVPDPSGVGQPMIPTATSSVGSGDEMSLMQPYKVVNYCIFAGA